MEFKRQPFIEKDINKLDPEKDINVCVLGRIIDIKENILVIDDGTGSVRVVLPEADKNLKTENIIRVFGQLISIRDEMEIRAEFYQKMDGLDFELYRKFRKLSDENV